MDESGKKDGGPNCEVPMPSINELVTDDIKTFNANQYAPWLSWLQRPTVIPHQCSRSLSQGREFEPHRGSCFFHTIGLQLTYE